jgi:hypothetical protein
MSEWIDAELAALRTTWPDLEHCVSGHHWVLLRDFAVPAGWSKSTVDLAVRIPANLPGEGPYGFWIGGGIALASNAAVTNYTLASEALPFSGQESWGQFSWAVETWAPPSAPGKPSCMVPFVHSVSRRLAELN